MRRMVITQRPGLINNNDDGGGGRPGARAESIGTCFTTGGNSSSWNACFMYINSHLSIFREAQVQSFNCRLQKGQPFLRWLPQELAAVAGTPFAKSVTRGR